MHDLGLSYKEVVEEIPYRNIVLMQYDKLGEVYDGENKEEEQKVISGKEMLKRKRG